MYNIYGRWAARLGRWVVKSRRWVVKLGRWVAKSGRRVVKIGRWEAELVARMLVKAALWVRKRTSLKNTKWVT